MLTILAGALILNCFGTSAKRIIMANKTNRGHVGLKNGNILKDVAIWTLIGT
jgi:hypothetical protein